MRELSRLDQLLCGIDAAIRTVCVPKHRATARENPAQKIAEVSMKEADIRHTAGLMRVNHAGEVCAQALYQGQALTAQLTTVKQQMLEAAGEEIDHLGWCEERLEELGSKPSVLNVIWYLGSLSLGALAGAIGDKWSLGFVAETERQVASHLQKHLQQVLASDGKTRAILEKMYYDEIQHANAATNAGARKLPLVVKELMRAASRLMTHSSYYI